MCVCGGGGGGGGGGNDESERGVDSYEYTLNHSSPQMAKYALQSVLLAFTIQHQTLYYNVAGNTFPLALTERTKSGQLPDPYTWGHTSRDRLTTCGATVS